MNMFRTDLAQENRDIFVENNKNEPDGVSLTEKTVGDFSITRVEITNDVGATALGKPIGSYVTIDLPKSAPDRSKMIIEASNLLKNELRSLVENINQTNTNTAMIIGLGNNAITPDSLGPKVAQQTQVTRHMFNLIPDEIQDGIRPVCALIPGVLGTTGIETAEIVQSAVNFIKPAFVIAIDALAARKWERVNRTIQLSNTGINPGAGIGNNRNALSQETIGVPVLAIGVPTVISAATLAKDVLGLDSALPANDLDEIIVTPKEIDETIDDLSEIIANGINYGLHKEHAWG